MQAVELICEDFPTLSLNDTVRQAMDWMDEWRVSHLPVVQETHLRGLIAEESLPELDPDMLIGSLKSEFIPAMVWENDHIYEVMKTISEENITVVPVVARDRTYLGATQILYLMSLITDISSIKEQGGVVVLEMNHHDYSLAEIAGIVESENARILSSYITSRMDSTLMELTLKINRTDLSAILRGFERYGYSVKASYHHSHHQEDIKRRYQALMDYLRL